MCEVQQSDLIHWAISFVQKQLDYRARVDLWFRLSHTIFSMAFDTFWGVCTKFCMPNQLHTRIDIKIKNLLRMLATPLWLHEPLQRHTYELVDLLLSPEIWVQWKWVILVTGLLFVLRLCVFSSVLFSLCFFLFHRCFGLKIITPSYSYNETERNFGPFQNEYYLRR